jgi:homogentisate 1,2-dioxygenase
LSLYLRCNTNSLWDRFSANKRAQELLAQIKDDKIAEKKRLAPYYFGGFSNGANTSATEGVHSEELGQYLRDDSKSNGTNGVDGTNGVKA